MTASPFHTKAASIAVVIVLSMGQARAATIPTTATVAGQTLADFRKPPRSIAMIVDGFIWIDAEDFTNYGGWLLDTQFVHLMGSGYLIAAGIGKPVADATVEVDIPRAGAYRLWARAKNWLKDYAPGRFQILVNGAPAAKTFGAAPTEDWLWESAGEFDLPKGRVRLALRDLTGYYGRCDALVLTTDLAYTPPGKMEDIRRERARLTGLSLTPREAGEFDVIVVGAGAAGSCAALAAARLGARTALVQDRPVLGGNSSLELGVHISGAANSKRDARESGIIEEVGRIMARYGQPKTSEAFRMAAEGEKNLTVFSNTHVEGVEMNGAGAIAAVRAVDTLTGGLSVYRGKLFIDCSGDGWVGYYAGAKYRIGREARAEFDEDLAPPEADQITMSGCLMGGLALSYRAVNTGKSAPYTPPEWAPRFPSDDVFGRKPKSFASGQWWLEHRGDIDNIAEAEKSRDELLRITFGYWDWIKNVWSERDTAANYALIHVPIGEAKRESRRLMGDHILTQNDVLNAVMFPDRISYGGWPLDIHHPEGIYSGKPGPFDYNARTPLYSIPFRSLYSVNIDNLLFAGRCMSVTHAALGTVRVQGTLATLGQAAGTAAALCVRHNTMPRGLYRDHIAELQQTLLKHDQYIPGIANEDPLDLARGARVTASTTAEFIEFGKAQVRSGEAHAFTTSRAVMFPLSGMERLESVSLLLESKSRQPLEATLHLREAAAKGDFASAIDVATAVATVAPDQQSWVRFDFGRELRAPFAWVWLPKNSDLSWRLMTAAPDGACRAWGAGAGWRVVESQYYAFFTEPPIRTPTDYRAANVVSGVARIVSDTSNLWVSDPAQPLPQWLELDFGRRTQINAVYLTFDTDLNARFHDAPLVPQCVRDYELSCYDGLKWTRLVAVNDNFQRRRIHRFGAVAADKLRLTVTATNGDPSARVFEIRAYDE